MSELKRKIAETDPDYEDVPDQQAKRQRVLEQDAREAACKKITSTIKREFQREIADKEKELQQIDLRLNQARLVMDRLRACVVASYYGRANRTLSTVAPTNCSSTKVPPPNIHPTIKKFLGKAPKDVTLDEPSTSSSSTSIPSTSSQGSQATNTTKIVSDETTCVRATPQLEPLPSVPSPSPTPRSSISSKPPKPVKGSTTYDDRRARFKIKKKIVIGNVSRYIPVDQRESTDMSSHKWMVYVRGHKSDPDISDFVKKVWFFLHHSYKPNDHVEISVPPFHLTRRGWGEFPVRVQLHFVDSRNKKVDIIHHLKLDKTFTGLQKLGAETVVEVELEKDFFENDADSDEGSHKSTLPNGPLHSFASSQSASASTSSSSLKSAELSQVQSSSSLSSSSSFSSIIDKPLTSELLCSLPLSSPRGIEAHQSQQAKRRTNIMNKMVMETDERCENERVNAEDTPWIKTESEGIEDDENCFELIVDSKEEEVCMTDYSNTTSGYIETIGDHSIAGLVDEDFNVTITHDESSGLQSEEKNIEIEGGCSQYGKTVDAEVRKDLVSAMEVSTNQNRLVVKQASAAASSSMSLLTSSTLQKMKLQQQLSKQQQQQPPLQSVRSISLLTSQGLGQENATPTPPLPMSLPILNQNHPNHQHNSSTPTGLKKKFTVINIENQKKNKTVQMVTTATPTETISVLQKTPSPVLKVVSGPGPSNLNTQKAKLLYHHQQGSSTPSSSSSIITAPQNITTLSNSKNIQILDGQQILASNKPLPKIVQVVNKPQPQMSGNNSVVIQQQQPQSPVVRKVSLLSGNRQQQVVGCNSNSNQKRIIYLKPPTSLETGSSVVATPSSSLLSTTAPVSSSLNTASFPNPRPISSVSMVATPSPSTPQQNSKKQISLLTGLVINSAAKKQSSQNINPDSTTGASQNQNSLLLHPHQLNSNTNSNVISVVQQKVPQQHQPTVDISRNVNIVSRHGSAADPSHVIVTKTTGHPHITVNQVLLPSTASSSSSSSSSYSLLNPNISQVSKLVTSTSTPNAILAQTSTPNIVIAYPTSKNINYNVKKDFDTTTMASSDFLLNDTADVSCDIKMSVIGKTKHRGMQQAITHMDPEQERIWRQYQVLSNYKNLHKEHQEHIKNLKDTIEGVADVIPKLNPEEYPDVYSMTKAAVRLHPIIQTGANKLTHPYCAESREQWFSWPVGKQRASEWHRACFTLKYIKGCLQDRDSFKGEKLMTTKQLVNWCRLHAFSPQTPVFPKPDLFMNEDPSDPFCGGLTNDIPQSFTNATDLAPRLSQAGSSSTSDMGEVEIVLEEFVPKKVEIKEEAMDAEDESTTELLPLSDGALFVHDWMRKRGVKVLAQDNTEERLSADVLYQVMTEFGSDILRKAFSVYSQRDKPAEELTVQDVHSALCLLPVAAFCRNSYLGKEEDEEESGGSNASR